MKRSISLLLVAAWLAACSPATPTAAPVSLTLQYTPSTSAWLSNVYACAGAATIRAEARTSDNFDPQADLAIRVGQPTHLSSPAYQIGSDDVLVILNPQNPISQLTPDQVRGLFTGQIRTWKEISGTDSPVQVWVFPSGEDIQQVFTQAALGESPVSSNARLANTPEEMAQAIARDVNAVGLISRHGKPGNVKEVFQAASVPVLVMTSSEPTGIIRGIITCLQK